MGCCWGGTTTTLEGGLLTANLSNATGDVEVLQEEEAVDDAEAVDAVRVGIGINIGNGEEEAEDEDGAGEDEGEDAAVAETVCLKT